MNTQNQIVRTVLFISGLPENVLDSDLETFFGDYKDYILMIQVDPNVRTFDVFGTRKPRATIIFKDPKKAAEARNALNMRRLKGKTLNIMWHEKDNSVRYNNTANIFVKGISTNVTPREVYEVFMEFGEIISSKLCDDEYGNSLGYGYINYYHIDSAERAIRELNGKEKWGKVLEVGHFQKRNERLQSYIDNNALYVKCFPSTYTEEDIKKLFNQYGTISYAKVETDLNNRKFALVVFTSSESAIKAKELNGKKLDNSEEALYVDLLQKKTDRKRILSTKIREINSKLNQDFKNCNLHVKNLPLEITDDQMKEIFSKYGEVKSTKIAKFILVTKVNGEFKESEQPSGFGFVCYTSEEGAKKAMNELNGKHLLGFESETRPPLIINFFMPKNERKTFLNKIQGNPTMSKFPLLSGVHGPMMMMPMNVYSHPYGYGQRNQPYRHRKPYQNNRNQQNNPKQPAPEKSGNQEDEPNMKYLESLETLDAQREYIGEFLFRKIEKHPIAHEKAFTIDIIGRITGMILGIEDIKEIYDITTNHESLTSRINEALSLLEGQNA